MFLFQNLSIVYLKLKSAKDTAQCLVTLDQGGCKTHSTPSLAATQKGALQTAARPMSPVLEAHTWQLPLQGDVLQAAALKF